MKEVVLKDLLVTIKETKSFVLEQAPDVAQEMILLARIESVVVLTGSVFLFYLVFYFKRKIAELEYDCDDISMAYTLLSIISPIFGMFGLICVLSHLSCWFTPKYFLLKELSKLIGG